jgi:ABC-type phosphate transport system auxiliary subunit
MMRDFLNRWYGDDCSPWIWPGTAFIVSIFMIWGLPLLVSTVQ